MLVVDALLSYAFGQNGYALIPGGTKKKIRSTAISLESMLHNPVVKQYCPLLSQVERNPMGFSKGWTADFIMTKAGYVFHFIGLDEGVAGANMNNVRPTFIMPDDIDSREDSPVISENRFHIFTSEVLPTRQHNTLVYWAQNLISRYSVRYRIETQQVRVLTNRKLNTPVPAVRDLITEQRTVGGIVKDFVVSGKPTWRVWSLQRVQDEIDTSGLPSFLREYQHEVERSKEGVIVHTFDDDVHVISESQFAARYGSADAWKEWHKTPFNDWARTKTAFHANVAGYAVVSSQNTRLPGLVFYIPLSFAANAVPEDVATRLLSLLTPFAYGATTWKELVQQGFERENAHRHFASWQERLEFARAFVKNNVKQYSRDVLSAYNVRSGVMSHSEDTVRSIYNDGFGFSFLPSNPTMTESVEEIVGSFSVDMSKPHLFDDTKKGYTRSFIIAPDDKTKPYLLVEGIAVYPPAPYKDVMQPDELMDSDLMRYQLKNWRWAENKLTELGERIDVPLKLNDDFGQSLQMIFKENLLKEIKLTTEEKIFAAVEELLPETKLEETKASGDDAYAAHLATHRNILASQLQEKLKKQTKPARPSWADIG